MEVEVEQGERTTVYGQGGGEGGRHRRKWSTADERGLRERRCSIQRRVAFVGANHPRAVGHASKVAQGTRRVGVFTMTGEAFDCLGADELTRVLLGFEGDFGRNNVTVLLFEEKLQEAVKQKKRMRKGFFIQGDI